MQAVHRTSEFNINWFDLLLNVYFICKIVSNSTENKAWSQPSVDSGLSLSMRCVFYLMAVKSHSSDAYRPVLQKHFPQMMKYLHSKLKKPLSLSLKYLLLSCSMCWMELERCMVGHLVAWLGLCHVVVRVTWST